MSMAASICDDSERGRERSAQGVEQGGGPRTLAW